MQEIKGALVCPTRQACAPHGEWEDLDRMADEFDRNSLAKNTRRSYVSDWASWLAFCERHRIEPLPADPANVRRYLTQLGAVGGRKGAKLKPKSAQRHLAAIAAAHRAAGLTFDAQHPILKRTLNGILRTYGARQEGARALRADDIAAICKTFGLDLPSVRDKAIILLGFAGGFRRSEIVALDVSDLAFEAGVLRVTLRRSKTDQDGHGRTIVIMPGEKPETCAVAAARAWLRAAELEHEGDTPAFRPVGRTGVEYTRLSDKTINRIVQSACRAAHLKESYSAHSLRAGHVTEALAGGADRAAIKRQTGHRSDAMLDRYARETDLAANNSSSALGRPLAVGGTLTGAAVAKLTGAGNAFWCDEGPDYVFNRLEVSGPHERLYDFIGAASGPGFVDWRPEWHSVYEQIYFGAVRGGAPTREAAEHLARKLRDVLWRRHEEERARVDLDSHRVPLDLNTLIPIPRSVLQKGFGDAGQEWMWRNWGVRWPIRRVTFALERGDAGGVKPVAVFRFLSEDWSPWIALLRMRERWPELRFEMKAGYLS